jgi:hypothetical protein
MDVIEPIDTEPSNSDEEMEEIKTQRTLPHKSPPKIDLAVDSSKPKDVNVQYQHGGVIIHPEPAVNSKLTTYTQHQDSAAL